MKTALIKITKNEKESSGYADIFTKDDEKAITDIYFQWKK